MLVAYRVCKVRHPPYDGAGAQRQGARWNSAGRAVIYAADSFAGAVLEVLAHAMRPRTLPGPHHAVRIEAPDTLVEMLDPDALPGWDARDSAEARAFGDAWLADGRSAVLVVPAIPCRPVGRTVLINPTHSAAGRIIVSAPFAVPWDERLF
ncbi:MAG TPA: RES domain-containing protein [Gemmatimonadaceae bacterium]|nr:RES domain-containing protein [Gemmatimonadaceae bacterium]